MTSHGEMSWTKGLINQIKPKNVAGIISQISDLALVVSQAGDIKEVMSSTNLPAKQHLPQWVGKSIHDVLTIESVPKFDSRLQQFLLNAGNVPTVQLNHKATDDYVEFPILFSFHNAAEDDDVLMLGRDLRTTAEMQQQLVAAQIALENDYEAQRENDLKFRVLMEASDVATAFISVDTGEVVACNTAAETLIGKPRETIIDTPLVRGFETQSGKSLLDQLVAVASEQTISPVEAVTKRDQRRLILTPTLFRGTSGQTLLCKFKMAGSEDARNDQLQSHLFTLYQNGVDSIVFVNASGAVLSSNDAFSKLTDATHAQGIQGRPIADFLSRGSVDVNVMMENARRAGSMRLYATKIVSEHGAERAVEISTTQLKAGTQTIFAMVMRDSHRVETVRTPMQQVTDVDMGSVIELIGGHSLKDIVARTTDVVEKMCIETAVEMTSNNRVAVAEMLGLSRQSLYVKLRKYGLVNKNG